MKHFNYKGLAFAIILQAVEDYRLPKEFGCDTSKIEEFFKSDWCDQLLLNLKLTGKDILTVLESE